VATPAEAPASANELAPREHARRPEDGTAEDVSPRVEPAMPDHGQQHGPRTAPGGTPFRGVLALTKIREYGNFLRTQFHKAANCPWQAQ